MANIQQLLREPVWAQRQSHQVAISLAQCQIVYLHDQRILSVEGTWCPDVSKGNAAHDEASMFITGTDFNYPLGELADLDGTLTGMLSEATHSSGSLSERRRQARRRRGYCCWVESPSGDRHLDGESVQSNDRTETAPPPISGHVHCGAISERRDTFLDAVKSS